MDIERIIIISSVSLGVGLIALVAGIVLRFSKSSKAKAIAESVLDSCVDVAALIKLIAEAETHTDYSGDNKRDFVIARYLKEHNISVDELADVIATLVAFTKTVNITPSKTDDDEKEEAVKNDAGRTEGICRIAR